MSLFLYKNFLYLVIWSAISFLTLFGLYFYPGSKLIYFLFSVVSQLLLYSGFNSNAIFFDTFIGLFLWLGFWLKLTVRIIFFDAIFTDPVGFFDAAPSSLDNGLNIAVVGMLALLIGSFIRRFFYSYPKNRKKSYDDDYLVNFYSTYRVFIWAIFALAILIITASNFFLGIYQKGVLTNISLPLGFNNIYKWLLLFGFTSLSAFLINLELKIRNGLPIWIFFISIIETFFSSISMLSRGMILNCMSLMYGLFKYDKKIAISYRGFVVALFLFLASLQIVNSLRAHLFISDPNGTIPTLNSITVSQNYVTIATFTDRWVGIEGVLAIANYPDRGFKLLEDALSEKYIETELSFYDSKIIHDSPYLHIDKSKHHFLSLPGIVAFLFYPGSYYFLFSSMLFISFFCAGLEWVAYTLSGKNIIFTSIIAQVVAYRLANFGYVPSQSYLLFGAIFLTIILFYWIRNCNKFFAREESI